MCFTALDRGHAHVRSAMRVGGCGGEIRQHLYFSARLMRSLRVMGEPDRGRGQWSVEGGNTVKTVATRSRANPIKVVPKHHQSDKAKPPPNFSQFDFKCVKEVKWSYIPFIYRVCMCLWILGQVCYVHMLFFFSVCVCLCV